MLNYTGLDFEGKQKHVFIALCSWRGTFLGAMSSRRGWMPRDVRRTIDVGLSGLGWIWLGWGLWGER